MPSEMEEQEYVLSEVPVIRSCPYPLSGTRLVHSPARAEGEERSSRSAMH